MKLKMVVLLLVIALFLLPQLYITYSVPSHPKNINKMAEEKKAIIDPQMLSGDPDKSKKAILIVEKDFDFSQLLPYTKVARAAPPIVGYRLVRTVLKPKDVNKVAELEGIVAIMADKKIPYDNPRELNPGLDKSKIKVQPTLYNATDLIGAQKVWKDYGYSGKNVTIAIVDTGVDFGHPDLFPALARNATGYPLYFDADEVGLIVTNNTYVDANANWLLEIGTEGPNPIDYYDPWSGGIDTFDLTWLYPGGTIDISYLNTIGYASQSGEYHVGVVWWDGTYYGYWYPHTNYTLVIFVDNGTAGVYEAAFFDLDHDGVIEDFEGPFDWGHNAAVAADLDNDGSLDLSLGILGGYMLDAWFVASYWDPALEGSILEWDYKGRWLLLQYDTMGHGTQCASTAAGRGDYTQVVFGIPLMGVAPNASIIGVTALYIGDIIEAELWAAGFDFERWGDWEYVPMYGWVLFGEWNYTGRHKADIISNSWGWSDWVEGSIADYWYWYDVLCVLLDALMVPGMFNDTYPGTLIVHAAGNGGPGYGTVTEPGYAILPLTVGASTSYHYMWFFGWQPGYNDTIIYWSARGPTPLGFSKPDVVNVGAYAFTAAPIYIDWDFFGGTSMATPMTAGAAAVLMEAFRKVEGYDPSPLTVKDILMSTAVDLGEEPFAQGAGRVDVLKAVKLVGGEGGSYAVTGDSWDNAVEAIEEAWMAAMDQLYWNLDLRPEPTPIGWYNGVLASWYGGMIRAGERRQGLLYLFNPSDIATRTYKLSAFTYRLERTVRYDVTLNPGENLIVLDVNPGKRVSIILSSDLKDYYNGNYSWMNLWDWIDRNGDNVIDHTTELHRVNDAYMDGNIEYLTFNSSLIQGKPVLRIINFGSSYKAVVRVEEWDRYIPRWLSLSVNTLTLPPGGVSQVQFNVYTSADMVGPYEAYIEVEDLTTGFKNLIPVSFVVVPYIRDVNTYNTFWLGPRVDRGQMPYDVFRVNGLYDQGWRYEAGDWRILSFQVEDPDDKLVAIRATVDWRENDTDINVHGIGGQGVVWDEGVINYLGGGAFDWGTRTGTSEEYVWIWDGDGYELWLMPYSWYYFSVTDRKRTLLLHNVLVGANEPVPRGAYYEVPEAYNVRLDFYKVYFSGGYDVMYAARDVEITALANQQFDQTFVVELTFESSTPVNVNVNPAWYDDFMPVIIPSSFVLHGTQKVYIFVTVPAGTASGYYWADVEVQLGDMPFSFFCWIGVNVP